MDGHRPSRRACSNQRPGAPASPGRRPGEPGRKTLPKPCGLLSRRVRGPITFGPRIGIDQAAEPIANALADPPDAPLGATQPLGYLAGGVALQASAP